MRKSLKATLAVAIVASTVTLAADAQVSQTGAFDHGADIELPAAIGPQPQITLSYSSQSGNGLVGMGWELEGFPAITRMGYDQGIEYGSSDTFVGPDGRLINVNGSYVYRGEQESWAKYEPYNADGSPWRGTGGCDGGPCYWRVTEPDGTVLEYGTTGDSRIEAVGRGQAVREWALSKHSDTAGNFYAVTYHEHESGSYMPTKVTYNQGNGRSIHYQVEFAYEPRGDHAMEYSQNASTHLERRLKWIAVSRGSQQLRKYRLDYEEAAGSGYSRLIAMQEYGRDNTELGAKDTFAYQGSGTNQLNMERWAAGQGGWLSTNTQHGTSQWFGGDFNGDGRMDMAKIWSARLWNDGDGMNADVHLSNGATFAMQRWATRQGAWINTNTSAGQWQWFSGDFNGDGKTDLAKIWNDQNVPANHMSADVHVSNGAGFELQRWATSQGGWISTNSSAGTSQWFSGDFNGDGRTDLAKIWQESGHMTADVHVSTGTSFEMRRWAAGQGAWVGTNQGTGSGQWFTGDFNGDGKTDLMKIFNAYGYMVADVHVSNGSSFTMQRWATWQGGWISTDTAAGNSQWFTGDFNGDGRTDLAKIWNESGRMTADAHLSTGRDFVMQRWATQTGDWVSTNAGAGNSEWHVDDFDGDGRTDLLKAWNEGGRLSVDLHRSRGSSFHMQRVETGAVGWIATNTTAGTGQWLVGDFDGAGDADLALVWAENGHANMDLHLSNRNQPLRDLLSVATNKLGGTTTITYQPATQVRGAIQPHVTSCTGGTERSVCGRAHAASVPLVTKVAMSDGRGHIYSTRYEYENGRYLPGKPSAAQNLGFATTRVIDEQLGTWEQTVYWQTVPHHGRMKEGTQHASGGAMLSKVHYTYKTLSSSGAPWLVRTEREEREAYELGVLKYRTKTLYGYDAYGNTTLVSELNDVATDTDNAYQASIYINDVTQWRIGLPRTVRSCADALCSIEGVLQERHNYYDGLGLGQIGVRGELTMTSAWRSEKNAFLDTTLTYEASGQLRARTSPAGVVEERRTYDAASGAVLELTDANGHTVSNEYDAQTGELTAVTNANGHATRFEYDAFGRRTRTEAPHDGDTESVMEHVWSFNPGTETTTVHMERGAIATTKHLDGLNRVWKTTRTWDNGTLLQTDAFFDAAGRDYKSCAPHLSTQQVDETSCTTTRFDVAGRVVSIEAPRSGGGIATTTTAYDGRRVTVTDPAGNVTMTDYDPSTLTSTLAQPGGLVTQRQHDLLGREARVTDPAGNVATYTYNSLGWRLSQADPVVGGSTFAHNPLGQVTSQTDAAGKRVDMYYDAVGRRVRTDYAPLSATSAGSEDTVMKYDYLSSPGDVANGTGRLVQVRDRSGTSEVAYDVAGRLRTGTKTIDGVRYVSTTTYDRIGNRTSVTYPDGSVVRYRYETDAGHMSSITLDGIEVMRYANYNERGAPMSIAYGADINTISLRFESSTGELLQQQDTRDFVNNYYAYDGRGMLVGERDMRSAKPNGDTSKAFAYDPLGQMVGAAMGADAVCGGTSCSGSAWSKVYRYDDTGRVQEKDGKSYTYDVTKRFQLTRVAGETADRTYDATGRLLGKTGSAGAETYLYGADGFLNEHRRGSTTLHRMTYDHAGNRIKKEYLGTNPQTTWDLGNYKVVHDRSSGKHYHTLYVPGLHSSRIAHRTVEKPGRVAAAWGGYQDRALASIYEPKSVGGFLPWARHQGAATFKAMLNDLDGARGALTALGSLAMLLCLVTLAVVSLWQLTAVVIGELRREKTARPGRRVPWLAPTMLAVASAACVGNYDAAPHEQATADSISKDDRYGILQALGRGGTNQPVPGTFYYLNSPLGSTSVMFDPQGAALLRLEYFPDGTVNTAASLGSYIATHTFGQKEFDRDLDAYYNAFRYYDAATMRFTTPDAVKDSRDFLVHNIYAYTRNNPVNYVDPSGFWAMKADGQRGYKPVIAPKKPTYVPSSRPAARQRTGSYSNGADGAPRPKPAVIKRPTNPTKTDRFNRGPDGGERVPIQVRVTVPGRDYMPVDGMRGYHSFTLTQDDIMSIQRIMSHGMSSMNTPDSVHHVLEGLAMASGPFSWIPATVDSGLYLLVDGDLGGASFAAMGIVPGGAIARRGATVAATATPAAAAKVSSIVAHGARGRASEARVLDDMGFTKNTTYVSTAEGRAIPDALTPDLSVEIKDTKRVDLTKQIRIQTEAARAAGRESMLVTGVNTCVSGPCSRAFDTIVRRGDLGPH